MDAALRLYVRMHACVHWRKAMPPRIWWWTTLLLAALGLVMGGAHLLEFPVRAQYAPQFYMRVTSTLYRYFGLVGGPLQVLALIFSIRLVWLVRSHAAFRTTLAGTMGLALSLLLWFLLVQPVNAAWLEALHAGNSEAVQLYAQLRHRWEIGHLAAFTAWLVGFALLLYGVLRDVIWLSSRA
jgi:hypothetical protein